MEIEFDLTENDILALARRRQRYSPALRQRVLRLRYGYLVGFGLLGIGSLLSSQKFLSFAFLVLAIVSFLLSPVFNDWRLKRSVLLAYQNKNKRATLNKRILRATKKGLEEISPWGEIKVKWMVIDNISVTSTHAFISMDQLPSIIIPKDKVKEKFEEFIQVCRNFQENDSN